MVLTGGPIIKVGHYEADGAEVDLELGFVPDYIRLINANATGTEQMRIEWFHECGDGLGFSVTAAGIMTWLTSAHPISALDEATIDEGTENDDDDPCRIEGKLGVTIAAGFGDDADEIWFVAFGNANEEDYGDINAA